MHIAFILDVLKFVSENPQATIPMVLVLIVCGGGIGMASLARYLFHPEKGMITKDMKERRDMLREEISSNKNFATELKGSVDRIGEHVGNMCTKVIELRELEMEHEQAARRERETLLRRVEELQGT